MASTKHVDRSEAAALTATVSWNTNLTKSAS